MLDAELGGLRSGSGKGELQVMGAIASKMLVVIVLIPTRGTCIVRSFNEIELDRSVDTIPSAYFADG